MSQLLKLWVVKTNKKSNIQGFAIYVVSWSTQVATRSLRGAFTAQQRLQGIYVNGWIPKMPATEQKQWDVVKNVGGESSVFGVASFCARLDE